MFQRSLASSAAASAILSWLMASCARASVPCLAHEFVDRRSTKWAAYCATWLGKVFRPDADESSPRFVRRKFSSSIADRLVGPARFRI